MSDRGQTIATLVEGDFLYGATVLLNSAVANGFSGRFVIGCRDRSHLPQMLVAKLEDSGLRVEFLPVETAWHLANYKPFFLRQVFDRYPECGTLTYMDPDIVVCCPFAWIGSWSEGGPAVCADVNWMMPPEHPTRREWLAALGEQTRRDLHLYFNSGFLSLRREDKEFLSLWGRLVESVGGRDVRLDGKGDIEVWRHGGRWMPFFTPDQDTLNLALMLWEGGITTLGPDAMGFAGFGILPHAVGVDKPWRKRFLASALSGRPPRDVDKAYWRHAAGPVRAHSAREVAAKPLTISLCAALGRIYRRG
jgi:hypothetical protein